MIKKILIKLTTSILFTVFSLLIAVYMELEAEVYFFLLFICFVSVIFYFTARSFIEKREQNINRNNSLTKHHFHNIFGYLFSLIFLYTNIFFIYQSVRQEPISLGSMTTWLLFQLAIILLLLHPLTVGGIKSPFIRQGNDIFKNFLIFIAFFYSLPGAGLIVYNLYTEHANTRPEIMSMVMTELEEGRFLYTVVVGIPMGIIFSIFCTIYFRVRKVNMDYKVTTILTIVINILILLTIIFLD